MENTYIIAFTPGTSGRLIANFVWSAINDIDVEYNLTKYNSTHNFTPFAQSYDLSSLPQSDRFFFHKHPEVYKYLKFKGQQGVFITHIFPDFDTIGERFPNTKLILITWREKDYLEIVGNILFKNYIEDLDKGKLNPLLNILITKLKLDINSLTKDDYKKMCMVEAFRTKHEHFNSGFMNPIIPKDFLPKTLLLEYENIYNNRDITISLIENFTGKLFSENSKKMYDQYLIGRTTLLEEYMSWL